MLFRSLPWVHAGGEPARPGSVAQSPPPPSLPVRGPGKRRASSLAPPPPLSRTRILRPFFQPGRPVPADTSRLLTTSAPSAPRPQRQARYAGRRGCGDRQHAPYLGGDCQPVLLLAGLVKPAPPGKGLSANSPLHHHGSGIPAPPRQKPTLAPPQRCLTRGGTQAGFSYAKPQTPP